MFLLLDQDITDGGGSFGGTGPILVVLGASSLVLLKLKKGTQIWLD